MPGKDRRIASRQAQLNRRKKRQQRGPSGIPPPPPVGTGVDGRTVEATVFQATGATGATGATEAVPVTGRSRPGPAAARPFRARGERPSTYNYVGSELRRIMIMAGSIVAIIIVLGIVL
jgi:hypothetical protein